MTTLGIEASLIMLVTPILVQPQTQPDGSILFCVGGPYLSSQKNEPHSYPLVPQPKRNLTFWYPWNNKAHKRRNTARNYSSLLYQTLQPIVATLAPMIRHDVNVKVTPLRVHLYSKSKH